MTNSHNQLDPIDRMLDAVPIEHHANLLLTESLRKPAESTRGSMGTMRRLRPDGVATGEKLIAREQRDELEQRLLRARQRQLATRLARSDVSDAIETSAPLPQAGQPQPIPASMLRFVPAKPMADESQREYQPIGTIELVHCLTETPEWIDLLCMVRQGPKYRAVPVLLEPADPEEAEGTDAASRLILQRVPGLDFEVWTLRAAFARRDGVLGAFTATGMGVFVLLVFDLE